MPIMGSLARAFTYVIAAQVQAIGLIFVAWWFGDALDLRYPKSF